MNDGEVEMESMWEDLHEYILNRELSKTTMIRGHSYIHLTVTFLEARPNQTEVFMVQHITYFFNSDLSVVKPHDGFDPSS